MKEKWIREIKSKTKGSGFMVEAKVLINNKPKSINGGRFYASDFNGDKKLARMAAINSRNNLQEQLSIQKVINKIMTVDECYHKSHKDKQISIKTIERKESIYKYLMPDDLRKKDIRKVSTGDIQTTLNNYALSHSSDQIKHALALWKDIYKAALTAEIPVFNRTSMIIIPKSKKVVKPKEHTLTHEQFNLFADELLEYNCHSEIGKYRSISIWYACQIMLYTGLRPQEVYALTEEAINLKDMELSIFQSVGSNSLKKRQIIPTKTSYSNSNIPIPSKLKPMLIDLLKWHKKNNMHLLFTDIDGLPFEIGYVCTYICNVSKKCKKKYGFTFSQYELRHLFSKDLFDAHTNPKVIQALMRHASENMSLYYAYTTEKDLKEAVENRDIKFTENLPKK